MEDTVGLPHQQEEAGGGRQRMAGVVDEAEFLLEVDPVFTKIQKVHPLETALEGHGLHPSSAKMSMVVVGEEGVTSLEGLQIFSLGLHMGQERTLRALKTKVVVMMCAKALIEGMDLVITLIEAECSPLHMLLLSPQSLLLMTPLLLRPKNHIKGLRMSRPHLVRKTGF